MKKTTPKHPTSSPVRTETFPQPLMTFFRTNTSSNRRKSRLINPLFFRRRRLTASFDTQPEPSSPKVTCIGQVKSNKQPYSRRRRGFRLSKARRCCRWIAEALFCSSFNRKLRCRRRNPLLRFWNFLCGLISFGEAKKLRQTEFESVKQGSGIGIETEEEGSKCEFLVTVVDVDEGFKSPPRNALLLTRCRSASSSSVTGSSRFWRSPPPSPASEPETEKEEGEDENSDSEGVHVGRQNDNLALEIESGCRDSMAESRRDPKGFKLCQHTGQSCKEVGGESRASSEEEAVAVLKRCISDPGQIGDGLVSVLEVNESGYH